MVDIKAVKVKKRKVQHKRGFALSVPFRFLHILSVFFSIICLSLTAFANLPVQSQPSANNFLDSTVAQPSNVSSDPALSQNTLSSLEKTVSAHPELSKKLAALFAPPKAVIDAEHSTTAVDENDDKHKKTMMMDEKEDALSSQNNLEEGIKTAAQTPFVPWNPKNKTMTAARDNAFSDVANQAFPLTPEQIKTLNDMLDETKRAQSAAPHDSPPMPTSSSLIVNLAPGATPPVVRLSNGFVSSLVFVDSSGAPWPIEAYDLGNPTAFNIQWNKDGNTLMVQALSSYTYGNLAVKLKKLDTPVMITLVPGQQQIDYRVDLRLQNLGPRAKPGAANMVETLPPSASKALLDILDGVSPNQARKLSLSNNALAEAWLVRKKLYIRSRFTLLSPAWEAKMSSADGMNAYELPLTPLLLFSYYGKMLEVKVQDL